MDPGPGVPDPRPAWLLGALRLSQRRGPLARGALQRGLNSIDVGAPDSIAKSTSPTAQEQFDLSKLAYTGFGDNAETPGLGDSALYAAGMVTAIKNGSMLQVFGLNMDKETATELAKLAMARL